MQNGSCIAYFELELNSLPISLVGSSNNEGSANSNGKKERINGNDHIFTLKTCSRGGENDSTTNNIISTDRSASPTSSSCKTLPTIRLNLALYGNYRPEITILKNTTKTYFKTIDNTYNLIQPVIQKPLAVISEVVQTRYAALALLPAVPISIAIVAVSPIIVGVVLLGLPLFLPLFIIISIIGTVVFGGAGILIASTEPGRKKIEKIVKPTYLQIMGSSLGQQIVYDTGARPSPVSLADIILPKDMYQKLLTSLAVDFIGSCSYLIPLAGESFDVFWAPAQTVLICSMYGATSNNLVYLSFMEEVLPFTDFVPTACIGWVSEFGPELLGTTRGRVEEQIQRFKTR